MVCVTVIHTSTNRQYCAVSPYIIVSYFLGLSPLDLSPLDTHCMFNMSHLIIHLSMNLVPISSSFKNEMVIDRESSASFEQVVVGVLEL